MSRRTMTIQSNVQRFSSTEQHSDSASDTESLPVWERILMLALTYEAPVEVAETAKSVEASSEKV